MMYPVFWMKCACHVWPIVPGYSVGRCGWCKERPETPCEGPPDGKARPL